MIVLSEEQKLLNRRILFNESIGTIKYVGLVEGTGSELWYGVEWDDPTRGKHDGSLKGKRYFTTKCATSGSFVKASKANFGIDIFEAAKLKYMSNDESSADNVEEFLYNTSNFIERIRCVSLATHNIGSVDTISQLSTQFPMMVELDIEGNLLYDWRQVFTILDTLKNLRLINLTNNRMILPDENETRVYPNIKYLIINRMELDWNKVNAIVKHFPNLTDLKVCFNSINKVETLKESMKSNLKTLDLESNPVNEWMNISKLGELEELENLFLNNINIEKVYFDDADYDGKTNFCKKLKSLGLNQNKINSWSSVNELNKLKSLVDLQFQNNPLNESDKQPTIIQMFFAKIENLDSLNRTQFVKKGTNEKMGAEIDYIKMFLKDYLKAYKTEDSTESGKLKFNRDHPRYLKLIEKYGLPELEEVEVKKETVKTSLISLSIENELTGEVLIRKIPRTTTVQRLKMIISKLFAKSGFDCDSIQLIYSSGKNLGEPYELENEYRDLNFYAIEDGDKITVKFGRKDQWYVKHVTS